mmetsp:Transcript_83585/g.215266  ORF Transcript_83585/g.215266 Transcript_83585/m.215266 type:complete len:344 (-) Transcript_83585:670-1701(-)
MAKDAQEDDLSRAPPSVATSMYVHLRVPALNQERTVAIILRPSGHQHILEEIQRCVSDMTSKISCAVTAETPDELTKQLHSLEESVTNGFKDFQDWQDEVVQGQRKAQEERLRLMQAELRETTARLHLKEAELIAATAHAAAAREGRHRPGPRTLARARSICMPRSARQSRSRSEEMYIKSLPTASGSTNSYSFRRSATEQATPGSPSVGSWRLGDDYQGPRWWQAMRAEVEARKRAAEVQPMAPTPLSRRHASRSALASEGTSDWGTRNSSLRGTPACPVMSQRASPEEPMKRDAAPEAKQRGFTSMNAALARCWALSKRSLGKVRPASVPRPYTAAWPTDS